MDAGKRFTDEQFTLSTFYNNVDIVCPACARRALATAEYEYKTARITCDHCGHSKTISLALKNKKSKDAGYAIRPAQAFFDAELWYAARFRENVVWAYNLTHLTYLEKYIASGIRENRDRTHFTLVEKLPRFLQSGKNREDLLKVIAKLKIK